jgi:hypothetical protein
MDLQEVVFKVFLKIPDEFLSKYPTVEDKLIHLILIPHIALIAGLIVGGNAIAKGHSKLRFVILVAGYIVFIYGGYYGSLVVPLANAWFIPLMIFYFVIYIIMWIFPPTAALAAGRVAYDVTRKIVGRGKEIELLYEELEHRNDELVMIVGMVDETTANQLRGELSRKPTASSRDISKYINKATSVAKRSFGTREGLQQWLHDLNTILRERQQIIKEIEKLERGLF